MGTRAIQPATPPPAPGRPIPERPTLGFDPWLALAAVGLGALSLIAIHGAHPQYVARQAIYLAIGFVVMAVMSRFDYSRLRELKWGIYAALILMILLVLLLGTSADGADRAISLPARSC
jgi:rod shape determining protein RodA